MNTELFQNAQEAYGSKNYSMALKSFTDCLQDSANPCQPGEVGLVYHQIGNCLVKLGDYQEAIRAFSEATADTEYADVSSVNYNLGMAYAVLKDFEDAVKYFELAVSDRNYATPYKAYMGMGNALLRLGKSAEAGAAFRSAALDGNNPDPSKALLNLGVCFMALNRPADAVTSYESALQFTVDAATKNKLYANLGQAYVANNQFQQAVSAFESALADKTYFLNDAASVDYSRAITMVSTGTQVISSVNLADQNDYSGLDVPASDSPEYESTLVDNEPVQPASQQDDSKLPEDSFFTASDADLEAWSKGVAKKERKKRHTGLKVAIVIVVLLIALVGGAAALYVQGYGYPTQEAVAQELFQDPQKSEKLFAGSLDARAIDEMTRNLPETKDATVDGVNRSMGTSEVYVSVPTDKGGTMQYKISMARNMIGWKITDVELFFPSNQS